MLCESGTTIAVTVSHRRYTERFPRARRRELWIAAFQPLGWRITAAV